MTKNRHKRQVIYLVNRSFFFFHEYTLGSSVGGRTKACDVPITINVALVREIEKPELPFLSPLNADA